MEEQQELLPGIVVLNHKYLPRGASSAFKVGATSFALNVAACLHRRHLLKGLVLYRRDDSLRRPSIEAGSAAGRPTVTVNFSFSMEPGSIRDALGAAIAQLAPGGAPIVYYQTDALLAYHPRHIPCCVTHHGPFVEHFASTYSAEEAHAAYGGAAKVVHLAREQRKAMRALASMEKAFVLQHSVLQMRHLLWSGVPEDIIHPISPPILCSDVGEGAVDASTGQFLAGDAAGTVLLSSVARIDYFKNLELLVAAGIDLLSKGRWVRILITGGGPGDGDARQALRKPIPPQWQARFHIVEKLSQPALLALFKQLKRTGIFACTSRYETLGITPLEAALSGVCTVSPDLPWVECSRYLSAEFRYRYTVDGLSGRIQALLDSGSHRESRQCDALRERLSSQVFEETLIARWRDMSRPTASNAEVRPQPSGTTPAERAA